MSHLEERFSVVILSKGQVVRLLGRGYSLSLRLAWCVPRRCAGAGRHPGHRAPAGRSRDRRRAAGVRSSVPSTQCRVLSTQLFPGGGRRPVLRSPAASNLHFAFCILHFAFCILHFSIFLLPHPLLLLRVHQPVPRGKGGAAHYAGGQKELIGLYFLQAVLAFDQRRLGLYARPNPARRRPMRRRSALPRRPRRAPAPSLPRRPRSSAACISSKVFTAGPSATIVLE